MLDELLCGASWSARRGDGRRDLIRLNVLAGEARILQFIASPAQRVQRAERSGELGPYRVDDRDVATSLGGAKSLLGQQRLSDESAVGPGAGHAFEVTFPK